MLPSGVSGNTSSNGQSNSNPNLETVVLGDFETGLDGWTTPGRTELNRIAEDDFPAGVVSGQRGLAVEIDGDTFPLIENRRQVKDADFLGHPFLRMHVIATAEKTDSDLSFRFRLHHSGDQGGGSTGNGSSRNKNENVVDSELKTVPQLTPTQLQWDMSELSDSMLQTAKRLEIVWYLEDHEPDGGPRGHNEGGFDYEGLAVFDDIRLLESAPRIDEAQKQQKKTALHRNHGMIVDRVFEERSEGFERGRLVFSDGHEVSYRFEVVGPARFEYTIDGDTFEIGGGWE